LEKVTGIGGLFIKAKDPAALADWYETHLGVTKVGQSYDDEPWKTEAGHTVFAPFPTETEMFGPPEQTWMINFRVRDLDAMAKQLSDAGIEVAVDPTEYPNGRFASLKDPEDNPIQLWEPGGVAG
jgi:glyoxylase I family protein